MKSASSNIVARRAQGRLHLFMWMVWGMLAVFSLIVYIVSLPMYFASAQTICSGAACAFGQLSPESAKTLQALGLSAMGYAIVSLLLAVVFTLVSLGVTLVIVFRKSDDWMAMLVGLMLVIQGTNNTTVLLQDSSSIWAVPALFQSYLATALQALVFALFPDGRFVPRWTRWLVLGFVIATVPTLLPLNLFFTMRSWLLPLYILLWFVEFLTLAGAQLYRYYRVSNPLQRQQTKWVVFSLAVALLLTLSGATPILFFPSLGLPGSLYQVFSSTVGNFILTLIPLSFGIALLRYRLWDVDVLINRTLVYGLLTATLALIYFSLIFGLQFLTRGLIGQAGDTPLVIVISTLAIAALFQPLRHRIQRVIDRRFYRRKYDAAQALAAFSATLRHEVDLEQLREELVAVVEETMQPTQVFLWLPKPKQPRQYQAKAWVSNDLVPPHQE